MLSIEVDSNAVRLKLEQMPGRIYTRLENTIASLSDKLATHIRQDKLLGQVLNRRSGNLGRSIHWIIQKTPTSITGITSPSKDISYAAIHEFGGVFTRMVSQAWGRPMKNPHEVTFHFPQRSFMRTGFADMKDEITSQLFQAVTGAINE